MATALYHFSAIELCKKHCNVWKDQAMPIPGVLWLTRISVLFDERHWFSTADQSSFSGFQDLYFIATYPAQVNFTDFGHLFTS
jgi:hypothetical protein